MGFLHSSMLDVDKPWDSSLIFNFDEAAVTLDKSNTEDVLVAIIKDPDKLISEDFSVPKDLVERVLFWARIYSLYPSTSFVVHDKDDLSIVYNVVDQKTSKISPGEAKRMAKDLIDRAMRSKSLKDFSAKNKQEKQFYLKLKDKRGKIKISDLVSNIRTQTGQMDFIQSGIRSSSRYLPIIEELFKEQGLPWELTRIPFVESSFNIKADSKVGARGIWQIMGITGKKFIGVDPNYDERYSPFKASIVAAKLLEENYRILGTWPLAITAYNHGPGGLKNASKRLKTKDISKIVKEYKGKNFGFASKNFYSEFLAALYVTVYSDRIFGKIDKEPLMNFFYVKLEERMYVKELLSISMLSKEDLLKYNPELGKNIVNGKLPLEKNAFVKLPPRASYRLEEYFERKMDAKELYEELDNKYKDE